jgi:hypothetical protein
MCVKTQKVLYRIASICLAALSIMCAAELAQPGVLAQNLCNEFQHGCAVQSHGVPCKSTTCGTAFQLLQQQGALCNPPGGGNCTTGDYAGTLAAYFSSTATTAWANCQTESGENLPACDDSCITCANVYLYSPSCTSLDQCGSTTLPLCGAPSNPCN